MSNAWVPDRKDARLSSANAYALPWQLLTPQQVAYLASDALDEDVALHDGGETRGDGHEWTFSCRGSRVTLLHAPEGRPFEWTHPDGTELVGADIVSAVVIGLTLGRPTGT